MNINDFSQNDLTLEHASADRKNNINITLEMVYDIVAAHPAGWVELAHIINKLTTNYKHILDLVETWVSLSVMCLNPEKTMVRFTIPLY
jgi:hypothetical protein